MKSNYEFKSAVKEAYAKTGYRPVRGDYCNQETKCACGMGVLGLAAGLPPHSLCGRTVAAKLELPERFVYGFTMGFDGRCIANDADYEFMKGYATGVAVGKEFFDENS